MFNFIIKTFIKDYLNITNKRVREQYGVLCSILSIVSNMIMVIFKLLVGFMINSIALQADGFNNLSDVGSNLATLFGFKLASKHPDSDHPYGHGRYEYIAGLIISFLIITVSFSLFIILTFSLSNSNKYFCFLSLYSINSFSFNCTIL